MKRSFLVSTRVGVQYQQRALKVDSSVDMVAMRQVQEKKPYLLCKKNLLRPCYPLPYPWYEMRRYLRWHSERCVN